MRTPTLISWAELCLMFALALTSSIICSCANIPAQLLFLPDAKFGWKQTKTLVCIIPKTLKIDKTREVYLLLHCNKTNTENMIHVLEFGGELATIET